HPHLTPARSCLDRNFWAVPPWIKVQTLRCLRAWPAPTRANASNTTPCRRAPCARFEGLLQTLHGYYCELESPMTMAQPIACSRAWPAPTRANASNTTPCRRAPCARFEGLLQTLHGHYCELESPMTMAQPIACSRAWPAPIRANASDTTPCRRAPCARQGSSPTDEVVLR